MIVVRFVIDAEIHDVQIEPIDHPAVRSWIESFVNQPITYQGHIQDLLQIHPWNLPVMTQCLDMLRQRTQELATLGYTFSETIPMNTRHLNRHFTNLCHRWFTETQRLVSLRSSKNERHCATNLLSDINHSVHVLERYLPAARNTGLKQLEEIHIEFDSECNQWQNPLWWEILEEWQDLHTSADQHFDVILTSEILGKTLLRSYLDDDEPDHWDTSGHRHSLGGLQIQLGPWRKHIYESVDFRNWVGNMENPRFDYPIGNVINRDLLDSLVEKLKSLTKTVPVTYHSMT